MICTFKKKLAKVLCGVLVFAQLGTMQAFARPDWPSDTGIEAAPQARPSRRPLTPPQPALAMWAPCLAS